MNLVTCLIFDGTCAEAMRFYERTLGGKLAILMTNAESPMAAQVPPGSGHRIMHSRLDIDGGALLGADSAAGEPYAGMHGFSILLTYASVDQARRVFGALSEGGQVTIPLQKAFWVELFGMLVDRFGTPWMINGGEGSA